MKDSDKSDNKKHNGKRHDRQFREAAVKLVTVEGYSPKQAALSLGIPVNTLQYWIRKAGKPKEEAQTMETLRAKVAELERENRRLVMEKEILKKATAFFAKEQP
jgi:transposase